MAITWKKIYKEGDNAKLDAIAGLAATDSNIIVGNGATWVAESGSTARTSLGLGTGDSPAFAGLAVDTDTLFVNATTHFVGVNTVNPSVSLHVSVDGSIPAAALFATSDAIILSNVINSSTMRIITAAGTTGTASNISLTRSKGTLASPTAVANGDTIGQILGQCYDGAARRVVCVIKYEMDGVVGSGDVPGRMVFETALDGAAASTEAMRLDCAHRLGVGITPVEQIHSAAKVRADSVFNCNGTDGITDSAAGIPTQLTMAGGIVTAVTKTTYANTTFVPTVTLVGGGGNTVPVYTTNTGRYTRIADRCFVDIFLDGDGGAEGAGTGQLTIALPVAASASFPFDYIPGGHFHNGAIEHFAHVQIAGGASVCSLFIQNTASSTSAATGADQNNATRAIRLSFNYEI